MGEKRVSVRTLPSGEKVLHHPPDDAHPDGKMVLIRDSNAATAALEATMDEFTERHDELKQAHFDRIETKKAAQRAKGLPAEKSPF